MRFVVPEVYAHPHPCTTPHDGVLRSTTRDKGFFLGWESITGTFQHQPVSLFDGDLTETIQDIVEVFRR